MYFNLFKRKKKKPAPKAPEPKMPEPEPKAPPAAPKPPPPPREDAPLNGRPRPCIRRGAYMDELDRMSRVPGMRNLEVTTSRTFRWNFRDPVDGRDYEYYYQDQGPPMPHWGGMQRPPAALPPHPQHLQHGPPGTLVASSQPYYDYGYGGVAHSYPHGGGYDENEYPPDCVVM